MKNYCYLDIPNFESISDQIHQHLISKYDVTKFEFWNDVDHNAMCDAVPLLKQALGALGLTIANTAIIKTQGTCPVHVDYNTLDSDAPPRVLWPIKNCIGSRTNFFHIEREWLKERQLPNGTPYLFIDHNEPLVEIDSFELKQPAIINPNEAHNVVCDLSNKDYRISLTIETQQCLKQFLMEDDAAVMDCDQP